MAKTTKKSSSAKKTAGSNQKQSQSASKKNLTQMKQEAANAVGVTLKPGDNGHLTSRQAGSIGGQMVKKMIESYEKNNK